MHAFRLVTDANVRNLAAIRSFVIRSADMLRADLAEVERLVLAVDEASTNVIIHGYHSRGGPLEVEVAAHNGDLYITIRDQAPQFNPLQVPAPNLDIPLHERPIGGLGVHCMRTLMDGLIYRATNKVGNELTMIKRDIVSKGDEVDAIQVTVERHTRAHIVRPKGPIDRMNSEVLDAHLTSLNSDRPMLIMDLSGVTYLSSAGLHLLQTLYMAMHSQNGRFILVELPPNVRAVLEATGLDRQFEIMATSEDAMDSAQTS